MLGPPPPPPSLVGFCSLSNDQHLLSSTNVLSEWPLMKRILNFNDYKNCLFKNEIILKSQQRFISEAHNVYIEEINKIAVSSNDGKRL